MSDEELDALDVIESVEKGLEEIQERVRRCFDGHHLADWNRLARVAELLRECGKQIKEIK